MAFMGSKVSSMGSQVGFMGSYVGFMGSYVGFMGSWVPRLDLCFMGSLVGFMGSWVDFMGSRSVSWVPKLAYVYGFPGWSSAAIIEACGSRPISLVPQCWTTGD